MAVDVNSDRSTAGVGSEVEAKVWDMDVNHEGGMLRDEPMLELPDCGNAIFDTSREHVIGTSSK